MIALTNAGTADKVEVITVGTVSLDFSCTQVDKLVADSNPTSAKTVVSVGNIATATTTQLTVNPASSHEAMIREISLVNTHASASCTAQLQQTINAGTPRKISGVYTLAPGERLLINADGTLFVYDASGGVRTSVSAAMTVTVLTSGTAATYTTPVGCRAIRVRLRGGGSGGGGAAGTTSDLAAGGGGGEGGYTEKLFSPPSATYTYTVGAGGNGAAAGNNAGSAGSDTTFGSLTAKGAASGGGGMAAGTTLGTCSTPGAGGVAGSGGDVNFPGEGGLPGMRFSGTLGTSGAGGGDQGGAALVAAGAGNAATANTGAGGGGALAIGATGQAGGNAAAGIIIVEEFY